MRGSTEAKTNPNWLFFIVHRWCGLEGPEGGPGGGGFRPTHKPPPFGKSRGDLRPFLAVSMAFLVDAVLRFPQRRRRRKRRRAGLVTNANSEELWAMGVFRCALELNSRGVGGGGGISQFPLQRCAGRGSTFAGGRKLLTTHDRSQKQKTGDDG